MKNRHQKPAPQRERPRTKPYLYGSDRAGARGRAFFATAGGGAVC